MDRGRGWGVGRGMVAVACNSWRDAHHGSAPAGCPQDGDGKLTADELRAHLSRRGQEDEAEKIFAVLDADADGSITVAELKKAYNSSAELRHALGPLKGGSGGGGGGGVEA